MTAAMVRHELSGRALVISIDNPPVNVLSAAVRRGLMAAFDVAEAALAEGRIDRVVLRGEGRAFSAGADAREFDSEPVPPHLPDLILRLMRLPAVAAIDGVALGGGFEFALGCRARFATPSAQIGLPETTLGLIPGAGGTQRLPRLIGVEHALSLIPEGRIVAAAEALELGLVDALVDDPVDVALTADLSRPAVDDLPAPLPAPEAVAAARATVARRMKGQVAPERAIALIEAASAQPLAQGLAQERAAFLALREGPQARAMRHVFFAERAAGPGPDIKTLPPAPISSALVAGGGTMGAAIAYALSGAGIHVTLLEQDAAAETRARANVGALLDAAVARGKKDRSLADAQLAAGFSFLSDPASDLPPVDLAIEAVFEDLEVKRALFARLAEGLPRHAILATNTSYLDVNAIFAGLPGLERCLGLHFFAPAHLMRLVEVIRADRTSPQTLATAFGLTKRLGKIAVEAAVCDGFIGNRILTRYRQAGDVLLIEGALPEEVDAALTGFGMAMGPYAVQDLSGLDIAWANRQRKGPAGRPARYVPLADRMVEELRRLGRKSGAGWYDYADGKPRPSFEVAGMIEETSAREGITRRQIAPEAIVRQLMLAMIAEGFDILDEGIARRPADIDLVMVHGYGFPRWRGGPMHLAREWGLARVAEELAQLSVEDPLSWRVPPLLSRLVSGERDIAALN